MKKKGEILSIASLHDRSYINQQKQCSKRKLSRNFRSLSLTSQEKHLQAL